MVGSISHELRTPLQSIKLGLETINNGHAADDAESQKKILPGTAVFSSILARPNDTIGYPVLDEWKHIQLHTTYLPIP